MVMQTHKTICRFDDASAPSPVGRRLAQLMERKQVSVADLANRTGLAASTLTKVVRGLRHPTQDVLWKVANALDVRPASLSAFGYDADFALTRDADTPRFQSPDGGFVSRPLAPFQCGRPFEFYGIDLAEGTRQRFDAYPPRTIENLTVHSGSVELTLGREPPRVLGAGDWAQFQADVPHGYVNVGTGTASIYLVVFYQALGDRRS
ncbi:MAG: XRE family transcriptional regulator [Novosphingobium sp.]